MDAPDEDAQLRLTALNNASAILRARERADQTLLEAKEQLRQSNERLTLALEVGRLGDWSWNQKSDAMTLSPVAAVVFGVPADGTFTRTRMRSMMHEDDRARTLAIVEHALATRTDHAIEYRLLRPGGGSCWIASKGRGTYAQSGELIGMIGLVQDISDRKRIEVALEDESRVLELLNKTGAAIGSTLDLQSLVQTVTDAATELSGAKFGAFFYNVTNSAGESFSLFALSGAPREAFEKFGLPRNTPIFNPTFRGEATVRSDDITRDPRYGKMAPHHGMPQGHPPVCSYLAVPVISRSGEVIGGLYFGHPERAIFTEREERIILGVAAQAAVAIDNARLYEVAQRAAEERKQLLERERLARSQIERMSEMKDEFLATLSHELRTPLSAILGWTQVVRRRKQSEGELHSAMEVIERNARMQAQLIEDLLDMSRINSGKLRLELQTLQPESFVEAAIETVRPAAAAKGISVEATLDRGAGSISGDPSRLQQVLWNLLSNAIKFTPAGGKVQVRLQRVADHIELSVCDNGMGIDREFLEHVFERFRQADASTTRQFGGLGLGLSIVKQLVELHGGTVQVHSLGANHGTTFTVLLPVSGPARRMGSAPPLPDLAADYRVADLKGLKVMVLDDEPDARDLVERVLADCGAVVRTAASGAEALQLIEAERPDLLVSDVGMAGMDGYEVLRRVRALKDGGTIPAIALTAFARSEDRTRALRAGFLVHLSKPVEPVELVLTVASLAGRSRPQDQ